MVGWHRILPKLARQLGPRVEQKGCIGRASANSTRSLYFTSGGSTTYCKCSPSRGQLKWHSTEAGIFVEHIQNPLYYFQQQLVIGDVVEDEALHKALLDSQYFVCKVRNPSPTEDAHPAQDDIPSYVGGIEKRESNVGFVNWFKRLSEGTLHEDGIRQMHDHNSREKVVHFKVMDMTQLKSIIEDLNGVSYRSSTFVQGFND